MAAGQSSGRDWTGASGRLLGRVHLSIQSPYIQVSREAVLSIGSTSRAGRPRPICNLGQTTTCCIWWRQVNTPIMQKSGCGNESDLKLFYRLAQQAVQVGPVPFATLVKPQPVVSGGVK